MFYEVLSMKWDEFRFDKNLNRCLDQSPYTQRALALKLGIDETTVSKWAKGGNVPSIETIFEISNVLQVHPRALLFDAYEPMDDEELEIVEAWRKMREGERHSFTALFKELTVERKEVLKKTRVKRAKPVADAPESTLSPEQGEAIRRVRLALQELRVMSQVNSEFYLTAQSGCIELDRQFAALLRAEGPAAPATSKASAESHAPKDATVSVQPATFPDRPNS